MFENLLHQTAGTLLTQDLRRHVLPNSLLFSGPASSGKLTAALELARVLSCRETPAGAWTCTCRSCLKHKALVSSDLLITGARDCSLEIAAAQRTLLAAAAANALYIDAARYLFIRSIRKLTARFNPVLWEDDDKASKLAPLVAGIDELLEELDPARPLPGAAVLEKTCGSLATQCAKLENTYMYDSLPVAHIRKASAWARFTVSDGKKVLIMENADRMQDSVRNALLKILEEPPEDTVFILTTSRRGAIMPTVLSRVRTYSFIERTEIQQSEVVSRVFHDTAPSIDAYMLGFLPVDPGLVHDCAVSFWNGCLQGNRPDIDAIIKNTGNFEPRILFSLFFKTLFSCQRTMLRQKNGVEAARMHECLAAVSAELQKTYDSVLLFNISPAAALEKLAVSLAGIIRG